MEFLLRNIPNDYSYKRSYLDKHAAEIETLILGSSHAYYGLNPAFFSGKAFNASHISQSFDYDYALFEKYQVNFKKLKTIVLPISYFSLFGKVQEGSESWRVKNYTIYYGINGSKSISDHSEVLTHAFKMNVERLISFYLNGESAISSTNLGWGTRRKSDVAKDLIETGNLASQRHTKSNLHGKKFSTIFRENNDILNRLVADCKRKNIRLVLVTTPTYKSYYDRLNREQLSLTIEKAKRLELENLNVKYFNFLCDNRFEVQDFYDADHLSAKGAEKLSKILMDSIQFN